LNVMESCS